VMDPISILLGSKVVGYAVFGVFAMLTLYGAYRLIKRAGRREVEKEVIIEGQDKALRGSEAARKVEREGAKIEKDITEDAPAESPHIELRDSKDR